MIYDIITYNGERELFEIRYNVLKDVVDEFRVIEFDQTFSGKPKLNLFASNLPRVKSFYVTSDIWSKYEDLAKSSPNTEYGKGAQHWIREFCQKESIKDCLSDLQNDDILFIGDCDEIWEPDLAKDWQLDIAVKLPLRVYSYWLNNRSSESFMGTLVTPYKRIKDACLNELRQVPDGMLQGEKGWHFTSMGGHEKVKQKLTDSYTKDSYANDQVLDNLKENIKNNKDFLGRNFTYRIDEVNWPQYLKENRDKYKHLCLGGDQQS